MGTGKVRTSEISKSMADLIRAVGDEVLPSAEELSAAGWVTAVNYAKAVGVSERTARRSLSTSSNILTRKARTCMGKVMMFKAKQKTAR